jgi:hypothetical protein
MEINENENNSNSSSKKEIKPSSLKNNKFKGLTAEQIIKKYEDVLYSREKQFFELSQEIGKNTQKIQDLVQKKEKCKHNNSILKDILAKNEQLLKQELSNKEISFMKLSDLEQKYDDLQNKIDYIINKQNAIADSTMKEKERLNQDTEEGQKLIEKVPQKEIVEEKINNNTGNTDVNISEEINKVESDAKKENNSDDDTDNNENKDKTSNEIDEKVQNQNNDNNTSTIVNNNNVLISENKKEDNKTSNEIKEVKDKDMEKDNETKTKTEVQEKKETSFSKARERLNKIKKNKNEKVQKLNLSEFLSQSNNNNDNNA